jgi:hypothetical protein
LRRLVVVPGEGGVQFPGLGQDVLGGQLVVGEDHLDNQAGLGIQALAQFVGGGLGFLEGLGMALLLQDVQGADLVDVVRHGGSDKS